MTQKPPTKPPKPQLNIFAPVVGVVLVLSGEAYNALNRLPNSIAQLTALTVTEEGQDNVVGALKRVLNE